MATPDGANAANVADRVRFLGWAQPAETRVDYPLPHKPIKGYDKMVEQPICIDGRENLWGLPAHLYRRIDP